MNLWKWIVWILASLGWVCLNGCRLMTAEEMGLVKPDDSLKVSKNAFGASLEVHSRKDTSMHNTLQKLTYNKETGAFELDGLDSNYVGNASEVMKANIGQLEKMGPIVEQFTHYEEARGKTIAMGLEAGGELGEKIIGAATAPLLGAALNLSGPLGVGSIKTGGPPPPPAPEKKKAVTSAPSARANDPPEECDKQEDRGFTHPDARHVSRKLVLWPYYWIPIA